MNSVATTFPPKGDAVDWLKLHPNATATDVLALPCLSAENGSDTDNDDVTALSRVTGVEHGDERAAPLRNGSHYQITKAGVFFCEQHPERGELPPLWICSPLYVRAATRNENGHAWGRLLEWQDNDERWHKWALPMEMLKGDGADVRGRLLREGALPAPAQKARNHLVTYIQTHPPERTEHVLCVERTGWHGKTFVLPDHVIGEDKDRIVYQTEADHDCGLSTSGTLEDWREHVAKHCAGNTRHVFAICCAFAPPLMQWTGLESGGFHLRGSSSGGKSTAQRLAASVWGNPERYKKSWRTTDNALEGVAAAHNGLLLLLDEIKQVEEKRAGEIAYMLGNGEGKGRATREGGNRKRARWSLLFLSSGELSLADMMRDAGKRTYAGQEVRMADIPADAGKGYGSFDVLNGFASAKELADTLNANAARFHGVAGLHLLGVIAGAPETVGEDAKRMMGEFLSEALPKDASAQVSRVCSRFALVAIAGELASGAGITGWEKGEAERACKACFYAWLDAFGTADRESTAVFEQVRAVIDAHGESRFQTIDADDGRTVINRLGFKEKSKTGSWIYFVLPEAMRAGWKRTVRANRPSPAPCPAWARRGSTCFMPNAWGNNPCAFFSGHCKKRVFPVFPVFPKPRTPATTRLAGRQAPPM